MNPDAVLQNSDPAIRFFREDGTWFKPAGAVRVDVVLRGGDGGSPTGTRGGDGGGASYTSALIIPTDSVLYPDPAGRHGRFGVMSYAAEDLPDQLQVTVGKGGRPDGQDGYVLIITHLEES
jgi:hypothetical protein